jgi:hypothetical protein
MKKLNIQKTNVVIVRFNVLTLEIITINEMKLLRYEIIRFSKK